MDRLMSGIMCVCAKCCHHHNDAMIEFNFGEQKIYWPCTECKKMNSMTIKSPSVPFPKGATLGHRIVKNRIVKNSKENKS